MDSRTLAVILNSLSSEENQKRREYSIVALLKCAVSSRLVIVGKDFQEITYYVLCFLFQLFH